MFCICRDSRTENKNYPKMESKESKMIPDQFGGPPIKTMTFPIILIIKRCK